MALSPSMPSSSSNLFTLARSKLHLSASSKENHSLHRWVLLKNSINRSAPAAPPVVYPPHEDDAEDDDEEEEEEETDSFMFPDAGKLAGDSKGQDGTASEAKWLDSLLQALGGDDDDASADEDPLLSPSVSPLASPMSSSDDLVNQAYPFPVPYPPFHPPLVHRYELDSIPMPYDAPLPYQYIDDDVEDLSVPDAIEDTSDDESDATTTPSVLQSSPRSSLIDTSPPESRQQRRRPHVYIEDPHRYPFELDPLPFSDHFESYDALCPGC
jgi:hypothetical protein